MISRHRASPHGMTLIEMPIVVVVIGITADAGPITFTRTRDGVSVVTFHRDGSASEAGIVNPSFKGVIFVDGKVAISGTLRGKVTLAATGNIIIIIADDIVYATNPGAGVCNVVRICSGSSRATTSSSPTTP